jgi:vacuolar-type H+-ATPase subunit C/Vma6
MITPVDFAFVGAKLHGMRSKLYEADRLAPLMSLRNAFEMMASIYPKLDVRSRTRFERLLVEDHVHDLVRVATFLEGRNRAFFDWQLERYRVEDLKVLLRAWKAEMRPEEAREMLIALPESYPLPVDEVLATRRLNDVIKLMPRREFAAGVRRGSVHFHDTGHLFYIEAGLDQAYFSELCRRARDLKHADRRQVMRLLHMEVLIYSVLFIMRARLNYDMQPEDVREFLVRGEKPAPGTVRLEPIVRAESFGEMLAALPQSADLVGGKEPPADLAELQRRMWERLYLAANRMFYRAFFHMGCVEAFYYIKRVELANLVRVAELLRQEYAAGQIAKTLIHLPEN